jgi:hypothetical protein
VDSASREAAVSDEAMVGYDFPDFLDCTDFPETADIAEPSEYLNVSIKSKVPVYVWIHSRIFFPGNPPIDVSKVSRSSSCSSRACTVEDSSRDGLISPSSLV